MAAAALSRHEVNRIILTRPAVEAGERLGFLPGDLMAKVDPYLRPLFDALHDMLDPEKVSQHIERGVIEIAPLAFMRGRTLNDSFVILDEAQNTTPEQMKMFLTRLGFGSRMVVTGDITQVDLPREQQSGLIVVGDVLDAIEGIEFVRFGGEDVVRHKLVQRIVEAYDVHSQRSAGERQRSRPIARPRGARRRDPGRRRIRRRPFAPEQRCSRSRSSGRGLRRDAPAARGGAAPVRRWRPRSAGVRDGHLAIEFVDSRAHRPAQRRASRPRRADRRALVPDRRRRAAAGAGPGRHRDDAGRASVRARARRRRDLPRAHRATCARRSSTACCISWAWITRPTTARCWRCSASCSRREAR